MMSDFQTKIMFSTCLGNGLSDVAYTPSNVSDMSCGVKKRRNEVLKLNS